MKLYLVRHGESTSNKDGLVQGQADTELSDLGVIQAKRIAQRLSQEHFDKVYSSDLKRAVRTAEEILSFHNGHNLIQDKRLRERYHGSFQWKPKDEVDWQYTHKSRMSFKAPDGESVEDQFIRISNFMDEFLQKEKGK